MPRFLHPARAPGPMTRLVRRLVSVRFYIKTVMTALVLGLVLVPTAADLVNAATKTLIGEGETCRILRVIDGDTLSLICPEEGMESARLMGFDTPEKYSPQCLAEFVAAEQAAWALRTLIQKADRLTMTRGGRDRFGRALVELQVDGVDLARLMVRAGHARANTGGPRGSWC